MHNGDAYPNLSTLEEPLSHPDQDAVGTREQFEHVPTANVMYVMVFVRNDTLNHIDALQKIEIVVLYLSSLATNKTPPHWITDAHLPQSRL